MQFSTTAFLAALSLATVSKAAPTISTRDCSVFPWFIAPYPDSTSCGGTPAVYQPTSGYYNPNATSTGCQPLWDPSGEPMSFESVSINRDACPDQPWAINLYTDGGCGTEPVVVQTDSCVASPGTNAAGRWESFEAVLL